MGFYPSNLGHIETTPLINIIMPAISCINPMLGFVSSIDIEVTALMPYLNRLADLLCRAIFAQLAKRGSQHVECLYGLHACTPSDMILLLLAAPPRAAQAEESQL